jgi:hypothetical protein
MEGYSLFVFDATEEHRMVSHKRNHHKGSETEGEKVFSLKI